MPGSQARVAKVVTGVVQLERFSRMTIRRLFLLVVLSAIAFCLMTRDQFLGAFAVSVIPIIAYVLLAKSWHRKWRVCFVVMALVPLYATSSGPVIACRYLSAPDKASNLDWSATMIQRCYPFHRKLDRNSKLGRYLKDYHRRWIELAEGK